MHRRQPFTVRFAVLLCGSIALGAALPAQEPAGDDLQREIDELKSRMAELERELRDTRDGDPPRGEDASSRDSRSGESGVEFTPVWDRDGLERPGAFRGVYDKPFLMSIWRRAHVGGYTELEYHSFEDGIHGIPEGFRMHRTNLFLFTDLTERVHFGSEIEFETEFEDGEVSDEIEVVLEMAFVDWVIFEEFKIRGGALLPPVGRVNVNHDGPVRLLTERPLVSTFVIPSTFTEAGVGVHGDVELVESSLVVSYETYVVNGFDILDSDGTLSVDLTEQESLIREGHSSIGGDINGGLASTGRVAFEVLERLEVAGSWHVGTYDENGDNLLKIFAGDFAWAESVGVLDSVLDFGLEGEIAVAEFERDTFARTSGVPDRFWGAYLQAHVGGMPEALRDAVPHVFDDDGSRFTFVLRLDWVDLAGDHGSAIEPGINFRPTADTVFKFSYKFTQKSIGLRDIPGREDFDDDGFVFSLSSYF